MGNAANPILARLVYTAVASTSASGVLSIGATNNPTPCSDYAAYNGLYAEYRTLAVRLVYVPRDIGFSSTATANTQGPLVQWIVRGNATLVPTSLAEAFDNDGAVVRNTGQRFAVTLRMNGTPDADWKTLNSPVQTSAVALWANGLTNSVTYGTCFIELLVQFRSKI